MICQTLKPGRVGAFAAILSFAGLAICAGSQLAAQEAGSSAPAAADAGGVDEPKAIARPRKHRVVHKTPPKLAETRSAAETAAGAAAAPVAPAATIASAASKAPAPLEFATQLDKAGASMCREQVNALATSTMGNVVKYNTMSNWSEVSGDKRAVSLSIGQKYPDGSKVPFSVSQIVAGPNPQGGCDGFLVQVLPSPLSCGKLRDSISSGHGRQIGDLAGVALMQDAAGRTMLVPTAADTCVLVATRSVYAK